MRLSSLLPLAVLACAAGACAHAPAQSPQSPPPVEAKATPAPDPAALLTGHWEFTAELAGEQYGGTFDIVHDSIGWKARLVEQGIGEAPVTSVVVQDSVITIQATPAGNPATVTGKLQPDGTLAGKVSAGGEEGTFTAKKSAPPAG